MQGAVRHVVEGEGNQRGLGFEARLGPENRQISRFASRSTSPPLPSDCSNTLGMRDVSAGLRTGFVGQRRGGLQGQPVYRDQEGEPERIGPLEEQAFRQA